MWCRHSASIAFFLGAAMGMAEEKAPPPARPAPAEDSITAAKRELELIKASRDAALQPGAAMPRVSMPELHSGTPDISLKILTKKPELPGKSANWLVEAMEKNRGKTEIGRDRGNASEGSKEDDEPDGFGREARNDGDIERGGEQSRDGGPQRSPDDEKRRPEDGTVFNPLTPYLAGWMTPQDYALLGASLQKNAGPADTAHSVAGALTTTGLEGPATSINPASAAGIAPNKTGMAPPSRENPFLEALNSPPPAPLPSPAGAAMQLPPPAPAPIMSAPPASAPIAPAKSKLPDFVKPQTDEKYFKPLKRF